MTETEIGKVDLFPGNLWVRQAGNKYCWGRERAYRIQWSEIPEHLYHSLLRLNGSRPEEDGRASKTKEHPDKEPWTDTIRRSNGLVEHVCNCGIGHPAYASVDFQDKASQPPSETHGIHGCCGCCSTAEWQLADAREGCRKGNDIILSLLKKNKTMARQAWSIPKKEAQ